MKTDSQTHRQQFYAPLPRLLLLLSIMAITGGHAQGHLVDDNPAGFGPTSRIDPPVSIWSLGSNWTATKNGPVLTWLEPVDPPIAEPGSDEVPRPRGSDPWRLCWSRFDGQTWSAPGVITQSTRLFVNWADFPSLVETGDGAWIAHWPEKSGSNPYAYDIMLARSTDQGKTWTRMGKVHDDFTQTEHGFLSFVSDTNRTWAFWLDGRAMTSEHGAEDEAGGGGAMSLRSASVNATITDETPLDLRVCECCGTSGAMTSNGPIIVYRNRSEKEHRDIWIVRKDSEGWTTPAPVHADGWEIHGCPVNGPAVDANGSLVAVAWFTAADSTTRVFAAFSTNAGETFGPPILIDEESKDLTPHGRVEIVLDPKTDEAIVSWLDEDAEHDAAIRMVRVSATGAVGDAVAVAVSSDARASGFPRLLRDGSTLLLSWTDPEVPWTVRAGQLPMSAIPAPSASQRLESVLNGGN